MKELPALDTRRERFRFARQNFTELTQKGAAEAIGVSPQAVSQWERGEDAPSLNNLKKMADIYGVPLEWLVMHPGSHVVTQTGRQATRVPIVSTIKAGHWSPAWSPYENHAGDTFLYTDVQVSDQSFALQIDGSSMEPDFKSGDTVIIDPRVTPLPGDFVAARIDDENEATFKKFRPRPNGVIELVPLNPDWPVLIIDESHPGKVIGTMIEHRRYRKR